MIELGDATRRAAGYGLVGLGGLVFTGIFFKNFLPSGSPATSSRPGRWTWLSVAVGFEVNGAFLVAWSEFLDQTDPDPTGLRVSRPASHGRPS